MNAMDSQKVGSGLTVRVVELKGYEYAKIGTLAKAFDLSKKKMEELLLRLSEHHEIKVLPIGERSTLVNVADFHRALVQTVPPQNGLQPMRC